MYQPKRYKGGFGAVQQPAIPAYSPRSPRGEETSSNWGTKLRPPIEEDHYIMSVGSDAREFKSMLEGSASRASGVTNADVKLKSDIERLGEPVKIDNKEEIYRELMEEMSVPPMTKQEQLRLRQSKKSAPSKKQVAQPVKKIEAGNQGDVLPEPPLKTRNAQMPTQSSHNDSKIMTKVLESKLKEKDTQLFDLATINNDLNIKQNQMKDIIKLLVQQLNLQQNDVYSMIPQIYKDIMAEIVVETQQQRRNENQRNRPKFVDDIIKNNNFMTNNPFQQVSETAKQAKTARNMSYPHDSQGEIQRPQAARGSPRKKMFYPQSNPQTTRQGEYVQPQVNDVFGYQPRPTTEFRAFGQRRPSSQEISVRTITSPRTINTRQGVKIIDQMPSSRGERPERHFYPEIKTSVVKSKQPKRYYTETKQKWDFQEDTDKGVEPLLMSQLFVCNSSKNRLSLCKYMLNQSEMGTKYNSPRQVTPRHHLSSVNIHGLKKLEKKLTKTLKKQILHKSTHFKDTKFDQEVINEISESEDDHNEPSRGFKTNSTAAYGGPQLKIISQIMGIEPYDDIGDEENMHNIPLSMHKRQSNRNHQEEFDPMDFETIFLIGFNENLFDVQDQQDQQFYKSLNVSQQRLHSIKAPKILTQYKNPDPSKYGVKTKDQEILSKQIESMVKYYAMPFGVKYKKNKSTPIVQQVHAMLQSMEQQIEDIDINHSDKMNVMKALSNMSRRSYKERQVGPVSVYGDERSQYLVNMIKSIDDPTKERYVLISLVSDFNLVMDHETQQYSLAKTEVAIAIQFEEKNITCMDLLLEQIKSAYVKRRIIYLNAILKKVQSSPYGATNMLGQIYKSQEISPIFVEREFTELNDQALTLSKRFIQTQISETFNLNDSLQDFIGPAILSCFDLHELIKVISCLILERQMLFVSNRRDLITKVMFTLRDLILHKTDFQWHCFFITTLPTILIDNLNAPFPTMIGIMRDIFDTSVDELHNLYVSALGTPFSVASPCIVDIDEGRVMEIQEYKALKDVNEIMERNLQTAAQRQQAFDAQENLERVEREARPVLVPSFLEELNYMKKFQDILRRDNNQSQGNVQDIENIANELSYRLSEYVLMKSQLWVHFTAVGKQRFAQGRKNQSYPNDRFGNPNNFSRDPRAIGSDDDQEQQGNLSDIEIIQKQIQHYFDQTQFQNIVAQKSSQRRQGGRKMAVNQRELEEDENYQKAYRDYQFIRQFTETQMFVTYIESKLEN